MQPSKPFETIGIAKELEAEENPGGHDQRVILNPQAVRKLVEHGCIVSVQKDAGVGIGIPDDAYISAGATIQDHDALYAGKDLVIKYKGPSARNIASMTPYSTLFCMAHLDVFDARRHALEQGQVNVVTMERVRNWLEPASTTYVRSKLLAQKYSRLFDPHLADRSVVIVGFNERIIGAFQALARSRPKQMFILSDPAIERLTELDMPSDLFVVFDSADETDPSLGQDLSSLGIENLDLNAPSDAEVEALFEANQELLQPTKFGQRKIHCLFETGYCGTSYGLDLLTKPGGRLTDPKQGLAVLLGYGNVSFGAVYRLLEAKIGLIRVMTRRDLVQSRLKPWFKRADFIICAAEQDADLRGKNFYVTNENLKEDVPNGSVVIDLIGGTPNKRCPVEALIQTTFLPDVHFERDGVYIAGLWGWDLAGRVKESAETYSRQTTDVLLGKERLIDGLGALSPGVKPALVLGPYLSS